jgi:hypothetical protein
MTGHNNQSDLKCGPYLYVTFVFSLKISYTQIDKERRREMKATPTRHNDKNQWQGPHEDPKQKQDTLFQSTTYFLALADSDMTTNALSYFYFWHSSVILELLFPTQITQRHIYSKYFFLIHPWMTEPLTRLLEIICSKWQHDFGLWSTTSTDVCLIVSMCDIFMQNCFN